jgi:hypothetical protein
MPIDKLVSLCYTIIVPRGEGLKNPERKFKKPLDKLLNL